MDKVNINSASVEELIQIIHIGKKRAEKLIDRRPYKDIFELSNVLGLGYKRMLDILNQKKATV